MVPLRYNLRSLRVRGTTTLITASGIAVVVFVVAATLMLARSMQRTLANSGRPDDVVVIARGAENEFGSSIDEASIQIIEALPGIRRDDQGALAVPELVVAATMSRVGGGRGNVQIRGTSDRAFAARPYVRLVSGRMPHFASDEAVVGMAISTRFSDLGLGRSFEVRKGRKVSVVGVFESGGAYDSEVWTDRDLLTAAYGREGRASSVFVRLDAASALVPFQLSAENDRRLGVQALLETTYFNRQTEGTAGAIAVLGLVVAFLFSLGAMMGAMVTMHSAVANREREIGTLRALGFSRRSIVACFLFESVTIALGGGLVGAGLSAALGFARLRVLNIQSFSELVVRFEPTAPILAVAMASAGLMGVVGGAIPAVLAARVRPVVALRG